MSNFNIDYSFGKKKEEEVIEFFKKNNITLIKKDELNIHDFKVKAKGITASFELKSRRCKSLDYEDTLIGANKLAEAYNLFYKEGIETIFLFQFEDGLFYINPFNYIPKREYKLQRWDRGIDKPKGWLYFSIKDLTKIY